MDIATTTAAVVPALSFVPELSPALIALIPVIVALVQGLKQVADLGRFAPLISWGLGIVGAFLFPTDAFSTTVMNGVLLGMAASGLYSGYRTTFT